MLVKLQGALVAPETGLDGDSSAQNIRRALICYEGDFESMNGPVTITAEDLQRIADNHNGKLARLGSACTMGDCPPVQLDHSTSARDTVGRVVGELSIGDHMGRTGLFGQIVILGADNLEKVIDGRWTHLSIGADLEAGELQEITITPFPAARHAALLARLGGKMNYEAMLKYLMEKEMLPEDEAKTKLEGMDEEERAELCNKMKAKLNDDENDKTKMSDDDDEDDKTKMSDDDDEDDKTKMSDDDDEDDKTKMSDDDDEDDKTKMSDDDDEDDKTKMNEDEDEKEKTEMSARFAKFRKRSKAISLSMRKAHLGNTIARLKAAGKITPAEVRKIDIAKLSRENKATVDAVIASYANRQPVIYMGQFGTVKATSAKEIAKQVEMSRLEMETLSNMSFTKGAMERSGVKMAAETGENTSGTSDTRPVVDEVEMSDSDGMWDEIVRACREGREEDGKALFRKAYRMGAADTTATPEDMAELMSAFTDLENDFGSIVQMTGKKLGIKL